MPRKTKARKTKSADTTFTVPALVDLRGRVIALEVVGLSAPDEVGLDTDELRFPTRELAQDFVNTVIAKRHRAKVAIVTTFVVPPKPLPALRWA